MTFMKSEFSYFLLMNCVSNLKLTFSKLMASGEPPKTSSLQTGGKALRYFNIHGQWTKLLNITSLNKG